jgi:hypothetical protein
MNLLILGCRTQGKDAERFVLGEGFLIVLGVLLFG